MAEGWSGDEKRNLKQEPKRRGGHRKPGSVGLPRKPGAPAGKKSP